jgi:cold-inducible RNA-binding protein
LYVNIFVGNLAREVTEDDLRQAFEAFGQVSSAAVIKDRETQASRGFGFVEMANQGEATAAIQALNGAELKGRRMNVNEARPREDRPPRDSYGGGGRRGGGGGYGGGGYGDRDRRSSDRGGSGGRRNDRDRDRRDRW